MATEKSNPAASKGSIPGVKRLIAVSSGKGGVGKSTVSANLAVALKLEGYKVGLLDTDIYGPNIPLMMGVMVPPQARMVEGRGEMLIPPEAHGVKVMSMGFLTRGDQPVVWRGPMLHSVVSQFLNNVDWGDLDYLVIDMPPGTGDVQLSLTQMVALTGAVVVTTPQEVALQDVRKAILMFEKVGVPILGIVENMSYFVAPDTGKRYNIFGEGGGQSLADKYNTKLLAQMPLNASVREGGDQGRPFALSFAREEGAQVWKALASSVADAVSEQEKKTGTFQGIEIGGF